MAVRIRVRIVGRSAVDTAALLNSGFESDSPDVALPPALARRVVQWPPPAARYVAADTRRPSSCTLNRRPVWRRAAGGSS